MSYDSERNLYIGYIYKIENDINNKVYIGQTISTIAERWHGHMSAALNEKRCKSALYNAMRKYGREKFHIHEIINEPAEQIFLFGRLIYRINRRLRSCLNLFSKLFYRMR